MAALQWLEACGRICVIQCANRLRCFIEHQGNCENVLMRHHYTLDSTFYMLLRVLNLKPNLIFILSSIIFISLTTNVCWRVLTPDSETRMTGGADIVRRYANMQLPPLSINEFLILIIAATVLKINSHALYNDNLRCFLYVTVVLFNKLYFKLICSHSLLNLICDLHSFR